MGRVLDTQEFLDMICELLDQGQTHVTIPVAGGSMVPFLHSGDTVCLDLLHRPPKRGDILLYQRANGQYVLHRIYKILPQGQYLLLGDSQMTPEPVGKDQLRAKVAFVRIGEETCRPGSFRWWFFAVPWLRLARWRPQIAKLLALFRKKSPPAEEAGQ